MPEELEEPVEVKTREVPKIGIIFGPGSVRALAHSGVVDAFQAEKVPIHAIVGIGWGALVGGYYASEGNVTKVQWQLSKLKKGDLVDKALISGKTERQPVLPFIKKVVPSDVRKKSLENFTVPFACPTVSYLVGTSVFKDSGSFEDALEQCLPAPPAFAPKGVWFADLNAIEESIRYLKQTGANIIVYVNVLQGGDLFSRNEIKEEPELAMYWLQVRRSHEALASLRGKYPELRELNVSASRQGLLEVGNLRLLPLAGKRAGAKMISMLKQEFGF